MSFFEGKVIIYRLPKAVLAEFCLGKSFSGRKMAHLVCKSMEKVNSVARPVSIVKPLFDCLVAHYH